MNFIKKYIRYRKRIKYLIEVLGWRKAIDSMTKQGYYRNRNGFLYMHKKDIWNLSDDEFIDQIGIIHYDYNA